MLSTEPCDVVLSTEPAVTDRHSCWTGSTVVTGLGEMPEHVCLYASSPEQSGHYMADPEQTVLATPIWACVKFYSAQPVLATHKAGLTRPG